MERHDSSTQWWIQARFRCFTLVVAGMCILTLRGSAAAEPLTPAEVVNVENSLVLLMKPAYVAQLAKTGSTLVPNSLEWNDSLRRTVKALMSEPPADCRMAVWIAGGCGRHFITYPAGAMLPAVLENDTISTLAPTAARPVRRGDIVTYRVPPDPNVYLHRVIGLPDDRICMFDGIVELNGQRLDREPTGRIEPREGLSIIAEFRERLPGGKAYNVLWPAGNLQGVHGTEMAALVVPPGQYFLMGDNRAFSIDNRPPDGHALPGAADILGIAQTVILSKNPSHIGTSP